MSKIQSLRLAWIKRIFGTNDGTWKSYLRHLLNRFGGLFLFHCNYAVKDIPITSQFYSELLKWLSDFREEFDTERDSSIGRTELSPFLGGNLIKVGGNRLTPMSS